MTSLVSVVCALTDHDVFETVQFPVHVYRGFNLITDIQKSHDAHCRCATHIGSIYHFEQDHSVGPLLTTDELKERFGAEIRPYAFLDDHFPQQPAKGIVNIGCETYSAAPSASSSPSSPLSSSSGSSSGSKRSWDWSDEESTSDSEQDKKRARTHSSSRSASPLPLSEKLSRSSSSSHFNSNHIMFPSYGYNFSYRSNEPGILWLDKSESILKLPSTFRHLLLRPPHFGKSMFLSVLNSYFDIHGAGNFNNDFGSLAVVTKNSTNIPHDNQHLCLSFELSAITILSDRDDFVDSLHAHLYVVLDGFIRKYASELEVFDVDRFVESHEKDLLASTLVLVKHSKHKLYVGVDDYDAPSRRCFFADVDTTAGDLLSQQEIESCVDRFLWGPLQTASDVITKLFVTGTFYLESPFFKKLRLMNLSVLPDLHLSCGFTESEALEFAVSSLGRTPDIAELRRSCGEYFFPSANATKNGVEPVLHPQRFFSRMSELVHQGPLFDDTGSFHSLSFALECQPEESENPRVITTSSLIKLIATGAMELPEPMDAVLLPDCVTLRDSALYYLGAVTHDRLLPGILRVANSVVLSLIHSHIDPVVVRRYDLDDALCRAGDTWKIDGDPRVFNQVLTRVLRDQTQRSFGTRHEPDLRGIFELVLRNKCYGESECLVGPIEFFSSTGVSRIKMRDPANKRIQQCELRTLTLRGLWRAINANDEEPSTEVLQKLHEDLLHGDEETLLERPYTMWSPTSNAMETVLVRSFLVAEPAVPLFLAIGGAHIRIRHP
ncbi:hypothetical protein C8R43DRAFT_1038160 [Mycena crocata]|nr:hypothetical protein C8R43DRAFT_1038160 [Mycena crocata]